MSYNEIKTRIETLKNINALMTLVNFDQSTQAPSDGMLGIEKMMGYLSGLYYVEINDPKLSQLVNEINIEELNDQEKAIVKDIKKTIREMNLVPKEDFEANQVLMVQSFSIWQNAKNNNDYHSFKETLQKIINFQIKFANYKRVDEKTLYDVLLSDYEPGFNSDKLDEFFALLRAEIVPLLKKVQASDKKFVKPYNQKVESHKQKAFNEFIAQYIGFDLTHGLIKESDHPFTTHIYNKDVRFTTHFYEDIMESAIFSTLHEAGHGMYEQGVSDEITFTNIGGGTSMGVHESQSRFYENMIARNKNFWLPIFDKFNADYGLDMKIDEFMNYINQAQASLIRTEADELTYPLHIMIRYEIEKKIFNENLSVDNLDIIWNEMYKEYLGVDVPNDSEGILQDVHWSAGLFGYFPSYAVGSAISAQIYDHMNKQFSIDDCLLNGDLNKIKEFLNKGIHQYGATYNTDELLNKMMDESFNPQYFVDYLKNKYTLLYDLK